jgi:DNA-binding LacI/PurR family transcriptional regulator
MVEGTSRRLAREFREKISSGQWPVGTRVPTTRELAAKYRVSVNTIQNAFRELEAVDLVERRPRLGGYVKARPRALSSSATGLGFVTAPLGERATTIGVVGQHSMISTAEGPGSWSYRILHGCERELAEADFHLSMFATPVEEPDVLTRVLARIDRSAETLAGVLCFITSELLALTEELDRRNIPWVSINRPRERAVQNFVAQDAVFAGRLLGRCFARMGMRKVAMVSDRITIGRSTGDLYFGFMEGWFEKGRRSRDFEYLPSGGFDEAHGYAAMCEYLKEQGSPSAVLGSGDLLALGAMRALREHGCEVGRDVQLVGATGLDLAAYAHPPLTVSAVPMEQMGREAARMLLEMAREGVRRMVGRYIPANLIIRDSCRIPVELVEEESKQIRGES